METNATDTNANAENAAAHADNAAPAAPSALERRLDLSLAAADLEKDIEQRLRKIGKTVKMPGFRPGKVPASVIRRQYGQEAYYEALNAALDKAFGEAVRAQNLRVAGNPRIEAKQDKAPEAKKAATAQDSAQDGALPPLEFTAIFEVYPDIVLGDLADIEIERPTLEVGPAELDRTLEVLRKQRVRYEPVERAAAKGDRVIIDFFGKKDGEAFQGGEAKGFPFVLGEGAMLADFEAAVEGLKAGESKSFEMTFPADYQAPDLAGKAVTFEVSVKEVGQAILPDIDGEFAKALGIGNGDVDKMRAEIEGNLKREVKKRLQSRVKDQVMEVLLKVNPVETPKALIEMEINHLAENARQEMTQRGGARMKDFPIQREWFADQAKRRVTLGLILSEAVKTHALQPKPDQIKAIVEDVAQSYEHPQDVVRWYYANPQRLAEIEGIAIEDNVVNWVLSQVKVVDKPIVFDELMGARPF